MRTLKKTVVATLVTVLFTGFALAGDKEKNKRKGKAKNKPAAVKIESGVVEIDPLTKSLGFDDKDLQRFAESLGAENSEELAKMGAKFLGDFLSTEEGREASKLMAENGAKLLGQLMSGEDGGELNIDLSQLLGDGGELPEGLNGLLQGLAEGGGKPSVKAAGKAIIIGPDGKKREIDLGEGADLLKALRQHHGVPKDHDHADHDHEHDAKDGDKDHAKPEVRIMGKGIIIGPDGKKREFDLGEGGELPKAFMLRPGRDDRGISRFEWRKHEESDQDDGEEEDGDHEDDEDEDEDEVVELLEEITEQMERQNELLEEILERLEE